MKTSLRVPLMIVALLATTVVADAQQTPDPRVADLVRAGRVRVGLGLSPVLATKDPATGELRGVAVDLAHALTARLGVEVLLVEYPNVPKVLEGLKAGAWDMAFAGIDPARAAELDFSPPYMQVDSTYLVRADSSIRTVADADRPGVRIAVVRKGPQDLTLSRMLKRAELVRTDTTDAGFDLLRGKHADVLAASRQRLLEHSARLPGSRVLEDFFDAILVAMAVPKGQAGRLAYISEFIEEVKASGLVQRAIDSAGVRGVQVAPPGNLKAQ